MEMSKKDAGGKYCLKTFGCQMNVYDSQKIGDILAKHYQMTETNDPAEADIIFLNTCSIRENAKEKVFHQLGRWKKLKDNNPDLIIGIGGCVASQEGEGIVKRVRFVDLVFGPQTIHRLPAMIEQLRQTKKPVVDISFPEIEKFDNLPEPRAEGVKAFVSIMEGCSKYCSYCIVPYTRGDEISRPFDDVLAECAQLAEQGVREITLLGQNVNHYLGKMHNGDIADLALLIHYIAAIDGIGRIRFFTSHPVEFSDSLIEAYATVPELANHLHLPVQSGSDRVLAMMKRGHMAMEFKNKIRKLRKIRPDITISTDIIVGFPGETEKDFQDTMNLVAEIGFDTSFSFIFSSRPGTPAASLTDETPMNVKKERLEILQKRLLTQAARISEDMVGTSQRILIDAVSKQRDDQIAGRTENNRVVIIDGDESMIGEFIDVKITEALPNCLRAIVIEEEVTL